MEDIKHKLLIEKKKYNEARRMEKYYKEARNNVKKDLARKEANIHANEIRRLKLLTQGEIEE